MTNTRDYEVAEQFLNQGDDESFSALFRIYSPQLIAFFRRRGHEKCVAEFRGVLDLYRNRLDENMQPIQPDALFERMRRAVTNILLVGSI